MVFRATGVFGLVLVGCGDCPEVCTEVPVEVAGWDQRSVGPDQAVATVAAQTAHEAVVALGDVDGDGSADVGILDGGVVRVLSGAALAAGGEVGAEAVLLTVGSGTLTGLAAADIDGDGLGDVLTGNGDRWEGFTFAGGSTAVMSVSATGGSLVAMAGGGDVDGDGTEDLLVSQYFPDDNRGREITRLVGRSGQVSIGAGSAGYGAVTDLARPHSLAIVGDIDGDGLDDVASGAARNFGAVHLSVDWGNGPLGGLSNREVHVHECYPNPDGCSSQVEVAAPGDVDGDGLPDVIVNGIAPASAALVPGTDLADKTYKTSLLGGQLLIRREVTGADRLVPAGDIDGAVTGDGKPLRDLLAVKGDTAWLIVGQQLAGQPAFDVGEALHVFEGFAPGGEVVAVGAGDLDGDGLDDLLLGDAGTLHVLLAPPVDGEAELEEVCEVSTERKACRS